MAYVLNKAKPSLKNHSKKGVFNRKKSGVIQFYAFWTGRN
jgi:hypothetical protein